jgi:hypothetical protein
MASQEILHSRPKAKREGLLVEESGSEVLVYDLERHRVHCLNESAARIWTLCNGKRTVEEIAGKLEIALDPSSREIVARDAIAQLDRLELVEDAEGAALKMSRREIIRKIGIGALAAGIVLPLVTSIASPAAAQAASCGSTTGRPLNCPCSMSVQCASGFCNQGKCGAPP